MVGMIPAGVDMAMLMNMSGWARIYLTVLDSVELFRCGVEEFKVVGDNNLTEWKFL